MVGGLDLHQPYRRRSGYGLLGQGWSRLGTTMAAADGKARDGRHGSIRRFAAEHDVAYIVPVMISVAAFILAVLAWFAAMS